MPALPPDLYDEIVRLCSPLFRTEDDRDALLLPVLSTWEGFADIIWRGSERSFTNRLVHQLPGDPLKQVLSRLLLGVQAEPEITSLCQQIDAALALSQTTAPGPLPAYHQYWVQELSATRYQLDRRFVQLTLLLDQGSETAGLRFVQDPQRGKYDNLTTLLTAIEDKAVVLLGQPGSGKTTLLRRLQLEHAWAQLRQTNEQVAFFVSLNGYQNHTGDPAIWLALEWERRFPALPPFTALLQSGRLLLLLDGLNEMPHADKREYRAQVSQWQGFLRQTRHYNNTVLFSCRSLDYSAPLGSEAVPVRQVQVEPLAPRQIEQFLKVHLAERAGAVWAELQKQASVLTLFASPFYLRLLVEQVSDEGQIPRGRAALLTGFVRQALRREVERQHSLFVPDVLLGEDDIQQINRNIWATPYELPHDGPLIPQLAHLATAMQDSRQAQEARQIRIEEQKARNLLAHPQARELLTAGIQLNVLDKDLSTRTIAFYHQLFQEYFAARVLAHQPEPRRVATPWLADEVTPSLTETLAALNVSDPLPALAATGWEETMLLAVAMTPNQARFITDLIPVNLPLAARCAALPDVAVPASLVSRLQQALLNRVSDSQADVRARIAAAEALGELGDPRFRRLTGPYGPYLLPPFTDIPAGTYTIGNDEGDEQDEKPAHPVSLATFALAVFPVTNAEYDQFMQAGGYDEEKWWTTAAALTWWRGEGGNEGTKSYYRDVVKQLKGMTDADIRALTNMTPEQIDAFLQLKQLTPDDLERLLEEQFPANTRYRQPAFWDDSRFNHPAQPVVGITWFEAQAYCAWLSAQTGEPYDLPTEAEWEAAARGFPCRPYAYGETYTPERCNTFETHIRRTTPVGVFPQGQTPEGVADMSGNVWEWTRSAYQAYPYNAGDGREMADKAEERRVLRGGSWSYDQYFARAAARSSDHPDYRGFSVGFRVVCRPPSHDH